MLSQEIRRQFLHYFKSQDHTIVPSSSVIPHDDPTLLFINAGMNQFKDVLLDKGHAPYTRAVSFQKCIRVGGKHNDLENVGHTSRHLTFFEMLGNFSFGSYFKEEAIRLAWEVILNVFALEEDKIWVTVFREDDEAHDLWLKHVPVGKINRMDEADNFWAMGATGPCGPCSELYYDKGPDYGSATCPLEDEKGERFFEFWNLVFMQYNRDANGIMNLLPNPCVDTGVGLERVVSLKMGVDSVFETDVLRSLIAAIENKCGVNYNKSDAKSSAFHVIADHLRCLAFAVADGVQPSNLDRGYVLRKVLRRAVRYAKTLGQNKPFLADLLPCLIDQMGEDYHELKVAESRIAEILTTEEEAFFRTLKRGGNLLNQIVSQTKELQTKKISGDDAFKLKDTYGLPLEEIELIAKDSDLNIDLERYRILETEAKEKSKKAHKVEKQEVIENLFKGYIQDHGLCSFSGYRDISLLGKVTALVVNNAFVKKMTSGQEGLVVLDTTPFYAEMGGQIGDSGILQGEGQLFKVQDCQSPYTGVIAHVGKLESGKLLVGDSLVATVDNARRQKTANSHTATHLLHWALRKVLGEHVKQAGSVVEPKRLRFDFSHHKPLTKEELYQIEDLVNEKIRENNPVKCYELAFSDVQKRSDIIQFFGEKYGKHVRVVDIDFSKELCGGIHTSHVGNIGLFRIAKEGSIAAGIRRIDAYTGFLAEKFSRDTEELLISLANQVTTTPAKLVARLNSLLDENKDLNQRLKELSQLRDGEIIRDLFQQKQSIKDVDWIGAKVSFNPKDLRPFITRLMDKLTSGIIVLLNVQEDRSHLMVNVSQDIIQKGIKAVELMKDIVPLIDGKGGGKADMAQAGGVVPKDIPGFFDNIRHILEEKC